jgi:hypothetical protein
MLDVGGIGPSDVSTPEGLGGKAGMLEKFGNFIDDNPRKAADMFMAIAGAFARPNIEYDFQGRPYEVQSVGQAAVAAGQDYLDKWARGPAMEGKLRPGETPTGGLTPEQAGAAEQLRQGHKGLTNEERRDTNNYKLGLERNKLWDKKMGLDMDRARDVLTSQEKMLGAQLAFQDSWNGKTMQLENLKLGAQLAALSMEVDLRTMEAEMGERLAWAQIMTQFMDTPAMQLQRDAMAADMGMVILNLRNKLYESDPTSPRLEQYDWLLSQNPFFNIGGATTVPGAAGPEAMDPRKRQWWTPWFMDPKSPTQPLTIRPNKESGYWDQPTGPNATTPEEEEIKSQEESFANAAETVSYIQQAVPKRSADRYKQGTKEKVATIEEARTKLAESYNEMEPGAKRDVLRSLGFTEEEINAKVPNAPGS